MKPLRWYHRLRYKWQRWWRKIGDPVCLIVIKDGMAYHLHGPVTRWSPESPRCPIIEPDYDWYDAPKLPGDWR